MKEKKRIFLDNISQDFNFRNDLVIGPWCLKHSFSIDEIFNLKLKEIFLENKFYNDPGIYQSVERQHKRLLEEIAKYFKQINSGDKSINYYKNYISYWFLFAIHTFQHSASIGSLYLEKYKNHKIELIKYYKIDEIKFKNTHDFHYKIAFDEIWFSNLIFEFLKANLPESWNIKYLNFNREKNNTPKENSIAKLKIFLKGCLFPRVKSVYGFSFIESIILSTFLQFKKPIKESMEKQNYYTNMKTNDACLILSDEKIFELSKEYLPSSFKNIPSKKIKRNSNKGKIMLCGPSSLFFNEKDQLDLLSFQESGGEIIPVQHGACYADLYFPTNPIEYSFSRFISWGQKSHPNLDTTFDPLPSPQLKKIKNNLKSNKILFVSTSGLFYVPRLGVRDFNDSYSRYNNTLLFFKNINPDLIKNFEYKDMKPNHFSEVNLLKENYKNLKFTSLKPEGYLRKVKLVVMNNYSTFFYKSLVSNVPTILLTKKNTWKLHDEAKKIYNLLEECHISFSDMSKAAEEINIKFDNIEEWWFSRDVQKVRKIFCDKYACSSENYLKNWLTYLREL